MLSTLFHQYRSAVAALQKLDVFAGLALRVYLVPIFWMAGTQKLSHFSDTVAWFGNSDWGLELPLPWLMAALATAAELGGAILLALGLFTRATVIPLIITMLVAIGTVHWDYGWQAIADPGAPFATERVEQAAIKLERARDILREHGHYDWLTSSGSFVVLNNGIEFAATYLIMLLALLVWGPGRYLSADYWIVRYAFSRLASKSR